MEIETTTAEMEMETIVLWNEKKNEYYQKAFLDFKKVIEETDSNEKIKLLKKKYPFIKRCRKITKRTKTFQSKAYIFEIFEYYSEYDSDIFDIDKINIIYRYCANKIKGVYKHAQSLKTGYCNLLIMNGFSEEKTVSVCISKNTLEANEQWVQRLIKDLDNRFPHIKMFDKIIIISSTKNDLNGNATHCKDLTSAWKILKRPNNIKIIICCSNNIRISDILEMSEDLSNLNSSLHKNLRIIHDEAHNTKEGIPAHRDIIENIISQQNVLSYTPVSASNRTIYDNNNELWKEENLEQTALNYTDYDKTLSTDIHYSSCSKSNLVTFEQLKLNPKWQEFGVNEISKEIFWKVHEHEYKNFFKYSHEELKEILKNELEICKTEEFDINEIIQNIEEYSSEELIDKFIKINVDRRRKLEFCKLMANDKEKEAVNNGLNLININDLHGVEIFKTNEFNLHLISVPNRKIVTEYLCVEVIKKMPNAMVLGIYGNEGNKYHLHYDDVDVEVSHIMNKGQFNEKLDKLLSHLKSDNVSLDRPFIIIGNYIPTGESLTFVSYTYGTLRSNTRLISTNAEEDYQEGCRSNFMDTKFIENNPNWVMPEKFLIGPENFINNALSYEVENDARIIGFETNPNTSSSVNINITNHQTLQDSGGIVAIPVRITVDRSDPNIQELMKIIEIERKTDEDKFKFLKNLKKCVDDEEIGCEFEDKSGKFDFERQTLTLFRTYRKKEEGPKKGQWKFKNYQDHFAVETSFINSKNDIEANQCEILTCMDVFILRDENGKIIEKNDRSVWWMGYKY